MQRSEGSKQASKIGTRSFKSNFNSNYNHNHNNHNNKNHNNNNRLGMALKSSDVVGNLVRNPPQELVNSYDNKKN
jgi:hypothetical protein